jgi:predicted MPP superfamily phosphohydrolase
MPSPPEADASSLTPAAPPASFVRILHFADVHLGVETYGKFNPETGLNTRLEDFTAALNAAIGQALDAQVDLAVFAGDAYKARDPNQTHQRAFAGSLKRLTDAGVPVVMLVGNHDIPNTRGKAHALEIYGLLGGRGRDHFEARPTWPRSDAARNGARGRDAVFDALARDRQGGSAGQDGRGRGPPHPRCLRESTSRSLP